MDLVDTIRVEVATEYRTRAWQTVEVDLGPGEAREVDLVAPAIEGVAEMGIPVTPQVRCLGINELNGDGKPDLVLTTRISSTSRARPSLRGPVEA